MKKYNYDKDFENNEKKFYGSFIDEYEFDKNRRNIYLKYKRKINHDVEVGNIDYETVADEMKKLRAAFEKSDL